MRQTLLYAVKQLLQVCQRHQQQARLPGLRATYSTASSANLVTAKNCKYCHQTDSALCCAAVIVISLSAGIIRSIAKCTSSLCAGAMLYSWQPAVLARRLAGCTQALRLYIAGSESGNCRTKQVGLQVLPLASAFAVCDTAAILSAASCNVDKQDCKFCHLLPCP